MAVFGTYPNTGNRQVSDVVILLPVFRDWESASTVCQLLDAAVQPFSDVKIRVLLVDDGSPDGPDGWKPFEPESLIRIDVLRLFKNLGHQRAICSGICYIHDHVACDAVLVMDSDGEDRAEDAPRLIDDLRLSSFDVVFAERRRRFESYPFRAGYSAFRILHRILTGIPVRVGNFSVIMAAAIPRLVCMPELWSHYAGAVFKSKLRFGCVPMDRGSRIHGKSHMNLSSLVAHGLAGIASFYETVAARILLANGFGLFFLALLFLTIVGIKLFSNLAIPGWTTYTVGLVLVLFTQLLAISFSLVFILISNRSNAAFLPKRDCFFFIDQLYNLATRTSGDQDQIDNLATVNDK